MECDPHFSDLINIYASTLRSALCSLFVCRQEDATTIAAIILYQYLLPSFNASRIFSNKAIASFITNCARIMFRVKTMAIKQSKEHRKKISQYHDHQNAIYLKKELHGLVESQNILSDLHSMYVQIGRINNMLFGDYDKDITKIKTDVNVMNFPYETQVFLEISFTQEVLKNNFLENANLNALITRKEKYFDGLYELSNVLELYNMFWIKYKHKWSLDQLNDDNEAIKRSKMKEFAKKLNVDDGIVWSDEELETQQEKQEFMDLTQRLNSLLI
eukprot:1098970_1